MMLIKRKNVWQVQINKTAKPIKYLILSVFLFMNLFIYIVSMAGDLPVIIETRNTSPVYDVDKYQKPGQVYLAKKLAHQAE